MSTRASSSRNRALRPEPENLEDRQLLSAVVSGTDIDGDTWTLRLTGPGSLVVVNQNDASGSPTPLGTPAEIKTITIGGTDPLTSRIVGTVHKGASGDGKVFFQGLSELPSLSETLAGGQGPLSIDMKNFWLGNTTPAGGTATPTAPAIEIPDGVSSLRFGGVDTTHNQLATPASTAVSDKATVKLGLPEYAGTRIVIDKSIASTQTIPASGTTAAKVIQHEVDFDVSGRLSLFQANEIVGDAANPPGQFSDLSPGATGTGGTFVVSGTGGTAPFLNAAEQGRVTGQIGDLRIGNEATNLTAIAFDGTGSGGAKISNFSIGGETTNVLVIAPNGLNNAVFGRGMDKFDIRAHLINTLQANRGAVDSTVVTDRTISQIKMGGPVTDSTFESGYAQSFGTMITTVAGVSTSVFSSATPAPPGPPNNAQNGGGMTVLVAGDVTNSVFAASVEPGPNQTFGTPTDLILPTGHIHGKVEGKIDNTVATPDKPTQAFYAKEVSVKTGPIVPPNVPEPPFTGPQPINLPGINHHGGSTSTSTVTKTSVPKGPLAKKG